MPEGPRRDPKVSTRIRKRPWREHDETPTSRAWPLARRRSMVLATHSN